MHSLQPVHYATHAVPADVVLFHAIYCEEDQGTAFSVEVAKQSPDALGELRRPMRLKRIRNATCQVYLYIVDDESQCRLPLDRVHQIRETPI